MRVPEWIRRSVAGGLLIWTPACATAGRWKDVTVAPQPTRQTLYAGDVRVATRDGMVYAFRGVWVGPDSLGGWLVEPAGTEQGFALGDVTRLEVRGAQSASATSGMRTLDKVTPLLVVVAVAGIFAALAIPSVEWF